MMTLGRFAGPEGSVACLDDTCRATTGLGHAVAAPLTLPGLVSELGGRANWARGGPYSPDTSLSFGPARRRAARVGS
jgi:hypothetical protein